MSLSATSINRPVLAIVMSLGIVLFGVIGFTYLGVLFFIAVMSASLAAVAVVWSTYSKREREEIIRKKATESRNQA